jgi:hypothetical protein
MYEYILYMPSKYDIDYKIGPYNRGFLLSIFAFLSISRVLTGLHAVYNYFTGFKLKNIRNPPLYVTLFLNRYWLIFFTAIISGILAYIIVSKAVPKSNSWYTLLNNDYVIVTIGLCIWLLGPAHMALYIKGYNAMNFRPIFSIFGLLTLGLLIGILLWAIEYGKGPIYKYFITGFGFASIFVFLLVLLTISPLAPNGPFKKRNTEYMLPNGFFNRRNDVASDSLNSNDVLRSIWGSDEYDSSAALDDDFDKSVSSKVSGDIYFDDDLPVSSDRSSNGSSDGSIRSVFTYKSEEEEEKTNRGGRRRSKRSRRY